MEQTTTRYTYTVWDAEVGVNTGTELHPGLILSREEPWEEEDVRRIVAQHKPISSFLNFPEKPYFIIPSPPLTLSRVKEHPLSWECAVSASPYTPKDSLRNRGGRYAVNDFANYSPYTLEHRYLLVPNLTTVLGRELHPSTLRYKFTAVWNGGHRSFSYKEMWESCNIVQAMFQGYHGCPNCDLRGRKCLFRWFDKLLKEKGVPLKVSDFQHLTRFEDYTTEATPLSYRWNTPFKEHFKKEGETEIILEAETDQTPLPGFETQPRKTLLQYISRGKCKDRDAPDFVTPEMFTPRETFLDSTTINLHTRRYKSLGQRSAKARVQHNTVCGTGSDACVLREQGCNRWRYQCQTRWATHNDMLKAGVKAFKRDVTYTESDFLFAFYFGDTSFQCVNPYTGLHVEVVYGGLRIRNGKVVHVISRSKPRSYEEVFEGTIEELHCFLRRWSPWAFSTFQDVSWKHTVVTDEAKVLYAESVAHEVYYLGMSVFGSSNQHDVISAWVWGSHAVYDADNTNIQLQTTSSVYSDIVFHNAEDIVLQTGWYTWFTWIPE